MILSSTFSFFAPATAPARSWRKAFFGSSERGVSTPSQRAAIQRVQSTRSRSQTIQAFGCPIEGLRSKNWAEFATPDAPQLDFAFTLCDDAAGETCPAWPGQPMTAHWGIEDPAVVTGTNIEKERAFAQAFHYVRNRITVFIALPIRSSRQIVADRAPARDRQDGRLDPRAGKSLTA